MDIFQLKSKFSHFKNFDFRPGQIDALEFIQDTGKDMLVICAPTGSGKSLINMVYGASVPKFAYLCSSKQLQRQLEKEFPEAAVMMGRNNFSCQMFPDQYPEISAADCIGKNNCMELGNCTYRLHKQEVLNSQYQIINYHYFLFEANFVGRFSNYELVICDEGDAVEGILADFVNLVIPQYVIKKFNLEEPGRKTATAQDSIEVWQAWGNEFLTKIAEHCVVMARGILHETPGTKAHLKAIKQLAKYEELKRKIKFFINNLSESWLFSSSKGKYGGEQWEFKPLWLIPEFTKEYFFKHSKRFVFTSATFPPKKVFAHQLGIDSNKLDFKEIETVFPVKNRPVKLTFTGDLAYKTFQDNIWKIQDKIVSIVNEHKDQKGIIHTISWKLNNLVMDMNRECKGRLITHDAKNKEEILKEFIESPEPLVFVSPSSTRGLDLPYDLCRFSILAKAPYLSMADKQVQQRVYSARLGQVWYRSMAAQEIVQSCGRGMRHEDDYCISYIIETQACKLVVDNQELFTRYFLDAVEVV
jgi:Rad3-related DNA helicase